MSWGGWELGGQAGSSTQQSGPDLLPKGLVEVSLYLSLGDRNEPNASSRTWHPLAPLRTGKWAMRAGGCSPSAHLSSKHRRVCLRTHSFSDLSVCQVSHFTISRYNRGPPADAGDGGDP